MELPELVDNLFPVQALLAGIIFLWRHPTRAIAAAYTGFSRVGRNRDGIERVTFKRGVGVDAGYYRIYETGDVCSEAVLRYIT